jgi:hypothetical protein
MKEDEALEDFARLLSLLPGVTIAWTQAWADYLRVGIKIEDRHSLGLLAQLNQHWNVQFGVETDWNCAGGHDEPSCLRYDLRIPTAEAGRRLSKIASVATLLLDELELRQTLDPEEAERRRAVWRQRS